MAGCRFWVNRVGLMLRQLLPVCATSGLMRRSKNYHYSITSSALITIDGGTVSPSAFAVLRLTTS